MPIVVYRNLNADKSGSPLRWSIASLKGKRSKGLVQGYAETMILADVSFNVLGAAQRGIFEGGDRYVHAWAIGTAVSQAPEGRGVEVTYNPRRRPDFHTRDGRTVTHCQYLVFGNDGRCFAYGNIRTE